MEKQVDPETEEDDMDEMNDVMTVRPINGKYLQTFDTLRRGIHSFNNVLG